MRGCVNNETRRILSSHGKADKVRQCRACVRFPPVPWEFGCWKDEQRVFECVCVWLIEAPVSHESCLIPLLLGL